MIVLKTAHEVDAMRRAGKITAAARALAGEMVKPGVSTKAIDRAVHDFIVGQGGRPAFLRYNGYPASTCISINDRVIHGIPDSVKIKEGDVVSVDVGVFIDGYNGDCAATYIAGTGSSEVRKLVEVTRQSFFEGIKFARAGCRVSDISHAIQQYAERHGYSVVREYVGHGIGEKMHEDPEVPNYGNPGHGPRLMPGMTIAVEPMVNMGGAAVRVLDDGWTVVTKDGKPSAHYENTVLITAGDPEILTPLDGDGGDAL
ncbi:MAG: type I methionyl aminopeptidase [Oscillospiraceae bacterium]|nr:type I methionyl aminopeptidase [Oscillospiraceae bacterium]